MNTYIVTFCDQDSLNSVVICKTNEEFESLMIGYDKELYRLIAVDIINVPVYDDILHFIKKEENLELGEKQ